MKIGVFDSGVGGQSVANAIKRALPDHEVLLREDKAHVPYGLKQPAEILQLVIPIFQDLVDSGCAVIVVACNTVTTTLIHELRRHFSVPLVAVEPMVKPAAAMTKTGVITVCATPTTLTSARYAELKDTFARGITVLEPDCSDWAAMIEENRISRNAIEMMVQKALKQHTDVIVLACTHYHWIESDIKNVTGNKAAVLQPEGALIGQLKRVLAQLV